MGAETMNRPKADGWLSTATVATSLLSAVAMTETSLLVAFTT
jgi:hypothetical protein